MSSWQNWLGGKGKPDKKPGWASFFSTDQYAEFKRLIESHFQKKGQAYSWGEGVILLKPDDPGGLHQLGLVNLAQLCARNPEGDWGNIVDDHFNTLDKSRSGSARLSRSSVARKC